MVRPAKLRCGCTEAKVVVSKFATNVSRDLPIIMGEPLCKHLFKLQIGVSVDNLEMAQSFFPLKPG